MYGSFQNIIQIRDKSAYEPATNKTISIGFFPDGFVFAILDNDNFRYLALEEYTISSNNSIHSKKFFSQLETFIRSQPVLNTTFKNTYIALYTPELVLIPEDVYDENRKQTYFHFCAKMPKDHILIGERMNILNARGIYSVPDDLICFLRKNFPGYRLKHHAVALIESTLAAQKLEPWQVDAVMHLRNKHFEIILLDNQQFTYYQSFSYQAFDDVLYYLFYVLEQHKLDASNMHMLLMGDYAMDAQEFQTLASFFKKVSLPERNDVFKYIKKFDNIPSHLYYNFLNIVTCG